MADDRFKVELLLTPDLGRAIQDLAKQMFGADAGEDSPQENLTLLLPDLIMNALAGDVLPGDGQEEGPTDADADADVAVEYGPGEEGSDPEIRAAVAAAEEAIQDTGVQMPTLEVQPVQSTQPAQDAVQVSFEEFIKDKRVHPDAVRWAKGNPVKESALIETLLGLHEGLWGYSQVQRMAERTYDHRTRPQT